MTIIYSSLHLFCLCCVMLVDIVYPLSNRFLNAAFHSLESFPLSARLNILIEPWIWTMRTDCINTDFITCELSICYCALGISFLAFPLSKFSIIYWVSTFELKVLFFAPQVSYLITLATNYQRIKTSQELTEYRTAVDLEMTDTTILESRRHYDWSSEVMEINFNSIPFSYLLIHSSQSCIGFSFVFIC